MAEYIDGLYFFTATCNSWKNLISNPDYQSIIFQSFEFLTANNFCNIYGFVIMPNHVHVLLGINPDNLKSFQLRFLKYTAQQIIRKMIAMEDPILSEIKSTQGDRQYQFWERRPKWISIVHSDIFWQKLSYIHNNPLQKKWRLADHPQDYFASSAASYSNGKSEFEFLILWE